MDPAKYKAAAGRQPINFPLAKHILGPAFVTSPIPSVTFAGVVLFLDAK